MGEGLGRNGSFGHGLNGCLVGRAAAEKMGERRLSDVMGRLQPSKTVALADLAKSMKEKGQDVVSLAVGEPDFPTPEPVAAAAIDAIHDGFTKYTQNVGMLSLRTAICQKLKSQRLFESHCHKRQLFDLCS